MFQFKHKYNITSCPECKNDLTQEDATCFLISTGETTREVNSRLSSDGLLEDVENFIANGYHAGTKCGECDVYLDEYEISEKDNNKLSDPNDSFTYPSEWKDWNDDKWTWAALCETGVFCPQSTLPQAIEAWIGLKSTKSLWDFLGLSHKEFTSWVTTNKFPERCEKKSCKH